MIFYSRKITVGFVLFCIAGSVFPAPVRVGFFMGSGNDEDWHTSIHTAGTVIQSMLANPTTEAYTGCPPACPLGPSITVPPQGFTYQQFGDTGTNNTHTGAPTAAEIAAFINALDTLDVVILPSCDEFGAMITDSGDRMKFLNFASQKGVVSMHQTSANSLWPAFDSLEGAVFYNHPNSYRQATLKRDTLPQDTSDPSFAFLDRGLPDTAFTDEWFSFQQTGAAIRATPYLKVTLTVDENSYVGGLGGALAMGDHPMSWYRNFPTGGRFFYTALVHLSQNMTTDTNGFWRRQMYNAIVWTAKQDGPPTSLANEKVSRAEGKTFQTSMRGSFLTVSPLTSNPYTVVVQSLNGQRVAFAEERKGQPHIFALHANSVYMVILTSAADRQEQLVISP
jgi:type 1 glutamine amidotransferase